MDAPFVLAAEARRRAVDHDLALAQREAAFVEQTAGEHPGEDAGIARHRAEQDQRLDAGRHDALELGGNGGRIGGFGRGNTRHDKSPSCATNYVVS